MLEDLREKLRKTQQDKDVEDKKGTQPKKYYAADADGDKMSKKTKEKRAAHFAKGSKEPAPGDADADTKPSQHTKKYHKMFGETIDEAAADKSLKKKADKTGMPFGILKQVFQRGVKAWQSGHRPGTTAVQWGHARVNSFVTKSKGTWGGADKDLAAKVRGKSESIEESADIKKQLKKVKGLTKKQLQMLATLPSPVLTSMIQQLSSLVMSEDLQEKSKLVAPMDAVFDVLLNDIRKRMHKEYRKNSEKGLKFINMIAQMTGKKVTDKEQQKNHLFLKMGDLLEDAAQDAAELALKQAAEQEALKAKHEAEQEALDARHERDSERAEKEKEDEAKEKENADNAEAAREKDQNESLWDNIRKKRARGEPMRKKGEKGAPTDDQIKRAQGEELEEKHGNKHDNGVLEAGTDEIRQSYQEDTPGQDTEQYIKEKEKAFHEQKNQVKKNFSDVFGNPLKGYPANEEFEVREI
tara:strand:+ start:455 stop:1858 length:1404 start_codon:yes stop_codon:yes gene_type:complete